MPLVADDFKVGMWITVATRRESGELSWRGGSSKYKEEYSGHPVQIKAISLPFLACWTGQHLTTIDTRAYELVKVDKKYVDVLLANPPTRRRKPKKEKPDPTSRCINCGCRVIQKYVTISREPYLAQWHYWCPECNRSNGEVPT